MRCWIFYSRGRKICLPFNTEKAEESNLVEYMDMFTFTKYTQNIMVADGLSTEGALTSAAMELIYRSRDIPTSVPEDLNNIYSYPICNYLFLDLALSTILSWTYKISIWSLIENGLMVWLQWHGKMRYSIAIKRCSLWFSSSSLWSNVKETLLPLQYRFALFDREWQRGFGHHPKDVTLSDMSCVIYFLRPTK